MTEQQMFHKEPELPLSNPSQPSLIECASGQLQATFDSIRANGGHWEWFKIGSSPASWIVKAYYPNSVTPVEAPNL